MRAGRIWCGAGSGVAGSCVEYRKDDGGKRGTRRVRYIYRIELVGHDPLARRAEGALTVTDNRAKGRYEMTVQGGIAFVLYRLQGRVVELTHAEVPPQLSGRGLGSELVRATLEAIRADGRKVTPRCSFVQRFMTEHPEFDDLRAVRAVD